MTATRVPRRALPIAALVLAACSPGVRPSSAPVPAAAPGAARTPGQPGAPGAQPAVTAAPVPAPVAPTLPAPRQPVAPPATAFLLGLMPVQSTGVTEWRSAHPAYDGRGVLIGILDSGVDPSVPGLLTTTTGAPKILDLRNFSSEGDVALERVRPDASGRIALPGGLVVRGASTVSAVAVDSAWYGGVIRELSFGDAPEADFNGNGSNRDSFGVVVVRSASGWVAFIDTNGDGSLADEKPLADYLVRRDTFTFGLPGRPRDGGPITGAVNLSQDASGAPHLSLVLDTAGHGTHVAGIAAGHDIGAVPGFDGVAPGAQIIGLKIADDARGGISTTGSMLRAMEYAARFAAERHLPLVLNMSFGIGNMEPGAAVMDSVVDAFLLAHPDVVFAIAAGNDGPGTETVGLPGSAPLAFAAGSLYPGSFAAVQFGSASPDVMGWWSSRGGELDKPDVVTPGIAYSTVPRWNTGGEVKAGTSMSTPHAAGLAALLVSALAAEGRSATAARIEQALRVSARHIPGATETDEGFGVPQMEAAYRWLEAGHAASRFLVRALPPGIARGLPAGMGAGPQVGVARSDERPSAAYRRFGLLWPGDTIQQFQVTRVQEQGQDSRTSGPATFRLSSDQPWLVSESTTVTLDGAGRAAVEVHYDGSRLLLPGRYVGSVSAVSVADAAAGPAFRLVSEIIVPDSATWGTESRPGLVIAAGRAWRTYVNVPVGASALAVRAVVADTSARGSLSLFEPGGRPSRTDADTDLGGGAGTAGTLGVSAEDLSPGVWEAVVQALPGDSLHFDFSATVPAVSVARVDSGAATPSVLLLSQSPDDTTLRVTAEQRGVATDWVATVEHGGPYTRTFTAPAWATQAVLEVHLSPELWEQVTDFGLTIFDRDGAQLGNSPMNYDFNRLTVDLPDKRAGDYPITTELFPAFALPTPPASFTAQVRVAFIGPAHPLALAGAGTGDTAAVALPAHGTAVVRIPAFTSLTPGPEWRDLVRLRVMGKAEDWASVVRTISLSRP